MGVSESLEGHIPCGGLGFLGNKVSKKSNFYLLENLPGGSRGEKACLPPLFSTHQTHLGERLGGCLGGLIGRGPTFPEKNGGAFSHPDGPSTPKQD